MFRVKDLKDSKILNSKNLEFAKILIFVNDGAASFI